MDNSYRPLNNSIENSIPFVIKIRISVITLITVSMPLFAFIYCIFWSLLFNFQSSTSTHCGVNNYLPSISSAIGSFTPQKYVWRLAIGLHSSPRYLLAVLYFIRYKSLLILILNIIEITSLVGLTFISSTENYPSHAKCFITFMISALIGMFSHLKESKKSQIKQYMAIINISAALFAVYFYTRHNWYCETGVYTLFALSEYLVVLSNMLFHFQAYHDLNHFDLCVISNRYESVSHFP